MQNYTFFFIPQPLLKTISETTFPMPSKHRFLTFPALFYPILARNENQSVTATKTHLTLCISALYAASQYITA